VSFNGLRREIGTANALLYVASRVLGTVTGGHARLVKYYITAQPVHGHELTPPRRGRQIIVDEATAEQVLSLPADRPRQVLEARLGQGGRCLIARKDGVPVGFQWFTLVDYVEDEVRCVFRLESRDRCAWDYDIYVDQKWRTQPVFSRLWDKCNEILRNSGVMFSLSRINAYNGASRQAHERIGARIVGWAIFICLWRAQLAFLSARPWIHVSFSRSRMPVILVSRMAMNARASIFQANT
jgi:GNAT superfamily N-acetyltransferase